MKCLMILVIFRNIYSIFEQLTDYFFLLDKFIWFDKIGTERFCHCF